ncbi:hypothetical protein L227DRAFT_575346 [Lentinus tigrinus ALCF2SS1-6]|uniref:Uncharacterized protein n=1 Tax=Lentinus tigrinus ALCF2SS1-6 TaxID=1328759 RepID=A0A5C2S951_9APHY|nr:hypothetical protein L227DRAFT_575346 [Lentinus tigrinus ALCF2SS1-6]
MLSYTSEVQSLAAVLPACLALYRMNLLFVIKISRRPRSCQSSSPKRKATSGLLIHVFDEDGQAS